MNKTKLFRYYSKRKSSYREKSSEEFDSSAVADLAFLLLIFFIVTSSFILRQGIFFSLPSESAGAVKVEKDLMVDIYPTEKAFKVDGAELIRRDLGMKLRKMVDGNSKTIAVIHMTTGLKYDRLVDSLSLIKESGVKSVSLKNYE